jgi:RNA polymerase sigma-70 factor (ECF subfamily)
MISNSPNDENLLRLIKGCIKKNREAQKFLYKEFYGYGMSICIRYGRNREEAVEVLNDAFMKVFTNIKKFDVTYPFKAWFRRILINESINAVKKSTGRFRESSIEEAHSVGNDEVATSNISHQEVVEMIQQLSPQYQTVFNLHVIEGYSHKEISKLLSISSGTSKSNLSKAKEKLRTLLNDYLEADERIRRG